MRSGENVIPYYTYSILIGKTHKPHPLFKDWNKISQEHFLVFLTKTVYLNKFLKKFAEAKQEEVILKIFKNIFDAYYEWIGEKDLKMISKDNLVFCILENYENISKRCLKENDFSKDFILSVLKLSDIYPGCVNYPRLPAKAI